MRNNELFEILAEALRPDPEPEPEQTIDDLVDEIQTIEHELNDDN